VLNSVVFKVVGDAITGHELYDDDDDDDIIMTTGTIAKTFRTYLSNIPRKHEIEDLKKSWALHILRKVVTRAENRFRLSAKRTSPFKSAGGGG
jgi:ligand-binding sensor protein